jgi:hypothetical protein
VVKEAGALRDDLCLTYVRLDFGPNSTFISRQEHDWHGENERAMVATREPADRLPDHQVNRRGLVQP